MILCQIGSITLRPFLSMANRPFSSCSVQCFFFRKALEKLRFRIEVSQPAVNGAAKAVSP